MALVSRMQRQFGHYSVAAHPDLEQPWIKEILADPQIEWSPNTKNATQPDLVSNTMFEYTLYSDRGIRAHLSFRRPSKEPEAADGQEACFLISIGDGVDGKTGRAHGGFNGILLDHISGHIANNAAPSTISPATATMTIDYKAPVSTPCVVLARAWLLEKSGRKVWVRAVLEDDTGKVLAAAKSLFIHARPQKI